MTSNTPNHSTTTRTPIPIPLTPFTQPNFAPTNSAINAGVETISTANDNNNDINNTNDNDNTSTLASQQQQQQQQLQDGDRDSNSNSNIDNDNHIPLLLIFQRMSQTFPEDEIASLGLSHPASNNNSNNSKDHYNHDINNNNGIHNRLRTHRDLTSNAPPSTTTAPIATISARHEAATRASIREWRRRLRRGGVGVGFDVGGGGFVEEKKRGRWKDGGGGDGGDGGDGAGGGDGDGSGVNAGVGGDMSNYRNAEGKYCGTIGR